LIRIQNISCAYTDTKVLSDLSLHLEEEDFCVLLGPNGAGKSTLLFCILGFVPLSNGTIKIHDRDLKSYKRIELSRLIAYVPQESIFIFDYPVKEIVLMGRYPHLKLMQSWTEEDHLYVEEILASLDLKKLSHRYYSSLSGGEKQRVLIARALAQDTQYIFLDETLSQLDISHQIEIMHLLRDIHNTRKTGILMISHNLNLAADYAQRLIFLKAGKIIGSGSPEQMMQTESLKELYGLDLPLVKNPSTQRMNVLYPGKY